MRLACDGVVLTYPFAPSPALGGVSARVDSGELVALVGPPGSGKSSLLLVMSALLKPDAGEVTADARDVYASELTALRRRLGVVFQFPETQLFGHDVSEELAFGPRQQGLDEELIRERVERSLASVGLDAGFATRSPFRISGGEQRRVAIAAALATEPEILLMDEPTAGLDPRGRHEMLALLRDLVNEGRGALVVSHDAGPLLEVADRVMVMAQGRIEHEGEASALADDPERLRGLGFEPTATQEIAAALRARGVALDRDVRWTPEALGDRIAETRP
jgi:energy-coupling factor transport system ATP-binding protein